MKDAIYLEVSEIVSVRPMAYPRNKYLAVEVILTPAELLGAAMGIVSALSRNEQLLKSFAAACNDSVRQAIVEQVAAEVKP